MKNNIKLVAVDIDGTFVRSDYTYDIPRFQSILSRMREAGCHKASGLKRLVERWGITPDQCAAFGDGGNDIEMLNYCGHSYAMENASENVKHAAKYVCPSNEEDGVLVTLDKIFMQP